MQFRPIGVAVVTAVLALAAAPTLGQGLAGAYKKVVADRAPAVVQMKFLLKFDGGEEEVEATGVMIEKTGLVVTSNFRFGGVQMKLGGQSITATNVKVMIGDDTTGVDAKVIARDSELGLTWVQIATPDEKGYAFVDYSQSATPGLGEPLLTVAAASKFFDRAWIVMESTVACTTEKPRTLIVPTLPFAGAEWGVPVFDHNAAPVGIITLILPDKEDVEAAQGGLDEIFKTIPGGKLILPGQEIVAATKRAKETAATTPAEPPAPAPAPAAAPK